ncbi:MAG: LCP family protein [bacterium]
MKPSNVKIIEKTVYGLCFLAILGIFAWIFIKPEAPELERRYVPVTIEGHVKKPGTYNVKYGGTLYDVLKIAGVNEDSDLRSMEVAQVITQPQAVNVGKLDKPVELKGVENTCVLSFYMNKVKVFDENGSPVKITTGMILNEQASVEVGKKSFAEIDFGKDRIITINKDSKIQLKEIKPNLKETFLEFGKLRVKVKTFDAGIKRFRVRTPIAFAGVKGTEYTIAHDPDTKETKVIVDDGEVEFGSNFNDELKVTVRKGESGTAQGDSKSNASVKKGKTTEEEQNAVQEEEKENKSEKTEAEKATASITMLYIGSPGYYVLIRLDPVNKAAIVMHIPSATSVSDVASGVDALGSAMSFGPEFAISLVERMVGMKIDHFFIQEREGLLRTLDIVGGIDVDVDADAAKHLGIGTGHQTLSGLNAGRFMSPGISGPEGTSERQNKVIEGIFKKLSEGTLVMSIQMLNQLIETMRVSPSFNASAGMKIYEKFKEESGWSLTTQVMPGASITGKTKQLFQPALGKIRDIFGK